MRSLIVLSALLAAAPAFAGGREAPSQHQRDGVRSQRATGQRAAPQRNAQRNTATRGRATAPRGQVHTARGHTYRGQVRRPAAAPQRQVRRVQPRVTHSQRRFVQRADPWNRAWRPAPRRNMVWVGGHYGRYGWAPGYWRPTYSQPGMVWVAGYWDQGYWVDGYWRTAHRAGYVWADGYYNGRVFVRGGWQLARRGRVVYR